MKILILTQWFDPEPSFKGLNFVKALVNKGHEVEVLTGFPNYPGGKLYPNYSVRLYMKDIMDGVVVHRVALYPDHGRSALKRILNYTSFGFFSCLVGVFKLKKFDVIYAYHPPLTTGFSASIISLFRRTPVVLDVQDLWPDTLAATGMLSNKKLLKVVGWVCNFVYKSTSHIAVLSPGFKNKLIERGVPENKITVVYNWCNELALDQTVECKYKLPTNGYNIVFAGNLGHAQGLDTVVLAAKLVKDRCVPVNFVLIGDGVAKIDAIKLAEDLKVDNLYFIPRVSIYEIGSLLKTADALLVHLLDDDLFKITIPSRTQAYLYCGKPILMAVNGDASDLITNSGGGVIAEPGNPESIAECVSKLFCMSEHQRFQIGKDGKNYYLKHLSLETGVNRFIDLFNRVVK